MSSMRRANEKHAVIQVRVAPRSSRDRISRDGDTFKLKLTAPPVEGEANKAAIRFLAKTLGIPANRVQILYGEKSRIKSLRIEGISREEVVRLLCGKAGAEEGARAKARNEKSLLAEDG
jgi:uncharacterized protein